MNKIRIAAMGKVNLSLNILGAENGMHLIDSVMSSVSLYDIITVAKRSDCAVDIDFGSMNNIIGADNTVAKAVRILKKEFDFGVDITVEKHLPLAGGMGGSSADAAGVLRALDLLYGFSKRGVDILETAAQVGADVPFMLRGGLARVEGFGQIVRPLEISKRLFLAVAFVPLECVSKNVYSRHDKLFPCIKLLKSDNEALIDALREGLDPSWHFGNALTEAADLDGAIIRTQEAMLESGAKSAFMTGSGSCVVGCFDNEKNAQLAVQTLNNRKIKATTCHTLKEGLKIL